MHAVIETGGKQYRIKPGDQLRVEKLKVEDGAKVEFKKVLAVGNGKNLKIGSPYIDSAKVIAEAIETAKADKLVIFKYKAKKDYRKKQGHRQPYTLVEIKEISADEKSSTATKKSADTEDVQKKKTPSLKSMRKAELIAYAKENNIELDEKATNAVMIETIENALK